MLQSFFLPFKLARRELRGGLRGFYIFMACIILGVAAIAGVNSLAKGLIDSLRYDGRYILGGDIALRTIYEPANAEQIKFLKQQGPLTVVMETKAMGRTMDEGDATLVELKAVDAFYPLYGLFELIDQNGNEITAGPFGHDPLLQEYLLPTSYADLEAGRSNWGVIVDPALLGRLDLKIGDFLYIGEQKFEIRATIKKEPDRIGSVRMQLGPRVIMAFNAIEETGLQKLGSQIYYDHKIVLPSLEGFDDLETVKNNILEAYPEAIWKGRTFLSASPTVERFINRLTVFLTFIGLTALLVGGVGVSNAIRSYLESRVDTIATMKCLGAPGKLVLRTYLVQILFMAALGIAIGLVLGAGVPMLIGPMLTSKLSITNHIGIYPDKLMIAALFGVLTVLTFSLWPLGRAQGVSAADLFRQLVSPSRKWPGLNYIVAIICCAEALACLAIFTTSSRQLAIWFVVGSVGAVVIFLSVAWIIKYATLKAGRPSIPDLRIALANLYRPGNATSSVILSLGLGLTVFVAIAQVEHNFTQAVKQNITEDTPAFYFLDVQKSQYERFKEVIEGFPTAEKLKLTPTLRGRISKINGVDAEEALVGPEHSWLIRGDRGFTFTDRLPEYSTLVRGKWWDADYTGPPIISITSDVAAAFNVDLDDEITVSIQGVNFTAKIANIRTVDWGSLTMNFAITFAPGTLESAPYTMLGTTKVSPDKELELQRQLAREFPNVTSIRIKEALDIANNLLKTISQSVRLSAAVTLFAGTLVLAGAVAAGHRRRIYDAVVLKVLGATRRRVLNSFALEYGLLGLLTALIAGGIGSLVAWAVQTYIMEMEWYFSVTVMVATALACMVITLFFGFIGTWRALGHKAAPLLRND